MIDGQGRPLAGPAAGTVADELRRAQGLSRSLLCDLARIRRGRLSDLLNGRARPAPEGVEAQRLAVALGVPAQDARRLFEPASDKGTDAALGR